MGKITVSPRLEPVKFVVIWKTSPWILIPQSSGAQEEAATWNLFLTSELRKEFRFFAIMCVPLYEKDAFKELYFSIIAII